MKSFSKESEQHCGSLLRLSLFVFHRESPLSSALPAACAAGKLLVCAAALAALDHGQDSCVSGSSAGKQRVWDVAGSSDRGDLRSRLK